MSSLNLVSFFDEIHSVHGRFSGLGFRHPAIALRRVELIRPRLDGERDYAFYLAERFLESLSFPGGRWRRAERRSVSLQYRSSYLDWLCDRFSNISDIYGGDCLDDEDIYIGAMNVHADPNWLLFQRLDITNDFAARSYFIEDAKDFNLECGYFRDRLQIYLVDAKSLRKNPAMSFFCAIADEMNLAYKVDSGGIVVEAPINPGESFFLEWADEVSLNKWGRLNAVFSVGPAGDFSLASRASGFRCALESVVPGGGFYTRVGKDVEGIALGALAHMELLRILVNKKTV